MAEGADEFEVLCLFLALSRTRRTSRYWPQVGQYANHPARSGTSRSMGTATPLLSDLGCVQAVKNLGSGFS